MSSNAEQLEKLAGLLKEGLLTRAEFDREKARLLGQSHDTVSDGVGMGEISETEHCEDHENPSPSDDVSLREPSHSKDALRSEVNSRSKRIGLFIGILLVLLVITAVVKLTGGKSGASTSKSLPPHLTAGFLHTCGMDTDNRVRCWGPTQPVKGANSAMYSLTTDDGRNLTDMATLAVSSPGTQVIPPDGDFIQVSAGQTHTCGLLRNGSVRCWGNDRAGQSSPRVGRFKSVSAGTNHSCALGQNGQAVCWGEKYGTSITAPKVALTQISSGTGHSCGIDTTGQVRCWGKHAGMGSTTPPSLKFRQIATSGYTSCGVTTSGKVECWGRRPCFSEAPRAACTPPLGSFEEVTVGFHVACAREKTGRVHCWGDNVRGQLNVPEKNFVAIAAGGAFVCGIEESGAVECWGTRGQMTTPPKELRMRTGR